MKRKLITKVSKATSSSVTTTIQSNLTYDPNYRVTAVDQYYNGSSTVSHVAAYAYSEAGQLVQKGLGPGSSAPPVQTLSSTYSGTNTVIATQQINLNPASGGGTGFNVPNGSTFYGIISPGNLQTVDYRYNIRGQVMSINNSKLTADGGISCDDPNAVFGMQFLYDGMDTHLNNGAGNVPKYDGRLTAVKWMSKDGVGYERSYVYAYDGVNRYTGETYSERTAASTTSFNNNVHGFDESGITYDAGGNIITLQRNSSTEGTNSNIQVDNLTYAYSATIPNQLSTVTDGTGANYTSYGFRNLTGSTTPYGYDNNGNLTNDYYKGISNSYNVLNRTDAVTVTTGTSQYINYVYDASGKLIRKLAYNSGTLQTQTDYLDGFVYVNGTLSFFNMPEGRVINNSGTFTPEYVITDDQGNARVSFQNNGSGVAVVKQENSYYGFGLLLANSPVGMSTPPNRFLYNGGSEWQNDYSNLPDYYQTFCRNYDQAIGRFVGIDPMSEGAESMTNYQYAGDNPIMMNDPDGAKAAAAIASASMAADAAQTAYYQNWGGNMNLGGIGGGAGGIGDSNWMNEGAFDDIGSGIDPKTGLPYANGLSFSSDGGREGNLFFDPQYYNKPGNNMAFWRTAFSIFSTIINGLQDNTILDGIHFSGDSFNALVKLTQSLASNQLEVLYVAENGAVGLGIFSFANKSVPNFIENGQVRTGVSMNIDFTGFGFNFSSYQWIQVASQYPSMQSRNGTALLNPFVDGTWDDNGNDVNFPFYYEGTEVEQYSNAPYTNILGNTLYFTDKPNMTGENGWFSAQTTLVGQSSNGQLTPLGTLLWGYGISGPGPAFPSPVGFTMDP